MNYEAMTHEELVDIVSELLMQLTPEEREPILSKYIQKYIQETKAGE